MDVYCDDERVGRVTKNAVDATANSIDIRVEGDTKTILYPDDSRYEIRISALDEGRMTFGQIDLIGRGVISRASEPASNHSSRPLRIWRRVLHRELRAIPLDFAHACFFVWHLWSHQKERRIQIWHLFFY